MFLFFFIIPETDLSTLHLSCLSRASRGKDRITGDEVVSMDHEDTKSYKNGLTDPGAFDTRARTLLTDCSAPSPGVILVTSRFLAVDSSVFLENVCCRAFIAREQAAPSIGRACKRTS